MRIGRRSEATSEMSFSTISDIAFLLIIFFMVTSSFIVSEGFHLVLPDKSQKPVITPRNQVLVLSLTDKGIVSADDRKLSDQEIEPFLSKTYLAGLKKSVLLQTGEETPYGRVVKIIELVKAAGFSALSLRMGQ